MSAGTDVDQRGRPPAGAEATCRTVFTLAAEPAGGTELVMLFGASTTRRMMEQHPQAIAAAAARPRARAARAPRPAERYQHRARPRRTGTEPRRPPRPP